MNETEILNDVYDEGTNSLNTTGTAGGTAIAGGSASEIFNAVYDPATNSLRTNGSGGGENATWGSITGTLSDQTDLQAALDAKVAKAGDTMSGPLTMTNGTSNAAIKVTQTANTSNSTSTGGAINLNNTGNTGAGIVVYSNQAAPTGHLIAARADNSTFSQSAIYATSSGTSHTALILQNGTGANSTALNLVSTNPNFSALGVSGQELTHGTIKVTHSGTGTDANAAAVSIDLQGSGTAAQGLYINASQGATTGKLIHVQNDTQPRFIVHADGQAEMYAALSMGNNKVTDVTTPTDPQDAANKDYVDGIVGADDLQTKTTTTVGQTGSGADHICDGTDDDVEINAAIQAVGAAGGGIVDILPGTYNTTATIVNDQVGVLVRGAVVAHFAKVTYIVAAGTYDTMATIANTSAGGFSNIYFDGNNTVTDGLVIGTASPTDKIKSPIVRELRIEKFTGRGVGGTGTPDSGSWDDAVFDNIRIATCGVGVENHSTLTSFQGGVVGNCTTGVAAMVASAGSFFGTVFTTNTNDVDVQSDNFIGAYSFNGCYFESSTQSILQRTVAPVGSSALAGFTFNGCFLRNQSAAGSGFVVDLTNMGGTYLFSNCSFDSTAGASRTINVGTDSNVMVVGTGSTISPLFAGTVANVSVHTTDLLTLNASATSPTNKAVINPAPTADAAAEVIISASAAGSKPLVVQGAPSQSGRLTVWKNSAGSEMAFVSNVGRMFVESGAAAAPSYSATADTNTGMFFPAADTVALATNGDQRITIDDIGNVGIGVTNPQAPLALAGAFTVVAGSVSTEWNPTSGADLTLGTVSNHPVNMIANGTTTLTMNGDGSTTSAGDLHMSEKKVINIADGTAARDAVNKQQLDAAISALQSFDNGASSADHTATTLYAVPAGEGGMYRVSAYAVVTQAATTSSTLPNVQVLWSDADTSTTLQAGTVTPQNTVNQVGAFGEGDVVVNAGESTNIQFQTSGYASSGATPMQYAIHLKVERI